MNYHSGKMGGVHVSCYHGTNGVFLLVTSSDWNTVKRCALPGVKLIDS